MQAVLIREIKRKHRQGPISTQILFEGMFTTSVDSLGEGETVKQSEAGMDPTGAAGMRVRSTSVFK